MDEPQMDSPQAQPLQPQQVQPQQVQINMGKSPDGKIVVNFGMAIQEVTFDSVQAIQLAVGLLNTVIAPQQIRMPSNGGS